MSCALPIQSLASTNSTKYRQFKKHKLNKHHIYHKQQLSFKTASCPTLKNKKTRKSIQTKVRAMPQPQDFNDFIMYSEFQLVSWVLPMTIAGRLMDMNYESIVRGLLIIAIVKSLLSYYHIIHY